jgi:hypothetical protein
MMGTMLDMSRNGVLEPRTVRAMLRRYALMGLNMMILYTEDTFEVPGEPFFGYLRGAYSAKELRELDRYAAMFGIEMFPCIQTLAHLAQILQWPAYADVMDTDHVLLAEHEPTYVLIEKLIAAASAPFRSKRIHLGMDEAAGIGTGKYKERIGDKRPFDILTGHLNRVREICAQRGLQPMIWSDMFFRLGSKRHDYYDRSLVIPDEVVRQMPRDVQLVYWDYYHLEQDFYEEWIDRHRGLGSEPIMAGGVWTWNRFWTHLPFSFRTIDPCLGACRKKGVREVFMTMWADGGAECDFYSCLPGLQYFAEKAFGDEVDGAALRANFRGSCDGDFDDWVAASDLDAVPCLDKSNESFTNVSKFLLWQDPLLAIMDPHFKGVDLSGHYAKLSAKLFAASKKRGDARRLRFPAQLARVLSVKAHLRRTLAQAYGKGDRRRVRDLVKRQLPDLRRQVQTLWDMHRELWMTNQKPFGWESVERRYGGLLARLQTVSQRLTDWLDGRIDAIPELDARLLPALDIPRGQLPLLHASRVATPSFLK